MWVTFRKDEAGSYKDHPKVCNFMFSEEELEKEIKRLATLKHSFVILKCDPVFRAYSIKINGKLKRRSWNKFK